MNSILYHQKQKQDSCGRRIYIGEDAYPYADQDIIVVADGLGGRGGYPHTKINKKILDRDLFYNIVFAPVFGAAVSMDFQNFVVNSFSEIFDTKDYYFENSATTRSSGYFASRLVTAITLYELKYNPYFHKALIFSRVRSASPTEKDNIVQAYGDKLAQLIRDKLSQIAANVGFEVETKISGAYLLPSTLTATLVDDRGDHVDTIYFWAGDSRGYSWDEKGLAQVTEDHEKDETMTNLITLTKPFRIESRFVSMPKPCILFNATDGCYKCPVFDSPFDLEYIFLKSIDESTDFNGSSAYLSSQFNEIGRHDDSNTMSLIALGFDNYENIQYVVRNRLKTIDDTIIAKLPGILQINYPAELQMLEEQIANNVCSVKDELISEEAVIEYVKKDMELKEYAPMIKELQDLMNQSNSCIARQKDLKVEIQKWIETWWIRTPQLKRYSPVAEQFKSGFWGIGRIEPYEQYADLFEKLNQAKQEHENMVAGVLEKLNLTNEQFRATLECLTDIKNANAFDYSSILENRNSMLQIIEFFKVISKHDTPAMQRYKFLTKEIKELNQIYVNFDAEAIAIMRDAIIQRTFDLTSVKMDPNTRKAIMDMLTEYDSLTEKIKGLELEMDGLSDKYLNSYWQASFETIIMAIWNERRELIPEALQKRVSAGMMDLQSRQTEMRECCAIRDQIYSEYDIIYRRIYRESKI